MFLRWLRYRDKAGRVRLYARLLSSHRQGGKVRQWSHGSLYVRIQQGVAWSEQDRRDFWSHLDHVLGNRPTSAERANIERVFASEVGPRPPPTAAERLLHAMHAAGLDGLTAPPASPP
jgi:hypothetical protein